ncbi:MAG TPA: cyclic nucleotide-binding domain-containing protein [Vicinamibacterales bacterium]|nr:cyclic nucleotide-binding domain-containing protein [Vicinamibacterales bacterium]
MEIETLAPILTEHPLLTGLSPAHVELIVGCASNVRFNPGEFIFRAGQEANRFYILRSGHVSIETFAPQRGAITIETVGEGELVGWSWLIAPYQWHFDARALSVTRAIALDAACLRRKCETDPVLGYELLKRFTEVMAWRLEATRLQLLDLYTNA